MAAMITAATLLTIRFTTPLMRGMSWRDRGRLRAPRCIDPEQASALQPAGQRTGCQIYFALSIGSGWAHGDANIVRRVCGSGRLRPGHKLPLHVVKQHGRP